MLYLQSILRKIIIFVSNVKHCPKVRSQFLGSFGSLYMKDTSVNYFVADKTPFGILLANVQTPNSFLDSELLKVVAS